MCVCVCCMYFTELIWLVVKVSSLKVCSASKHQSLVLCPSCVPEKVDINQKGRNIKYLHKRDSNQWK